MSTVKLNGWTRQRPPVEGKETRLYRQVIVEVVFALHHEHKRPATLFQIYQHVQSRVPDLVKREGFVHHHGKRWIDRRVNEAASAKFYENKTPKIVAVTAGHYAPNPVLFKVKCG